MPDRALRKQAPRKPITPGLIGPWRKLVEHLKLSRDYVQAIERAEQQAGELSTRLLGVEGVADGVVAASGQTIDHGSLSGLGDSEDHPYAALVDGSRQFTGNLSITAGATFDGIDVSAHNHDGTAGMGVPVSGVVDYVLNVPFFAPVVLTGPLAASVVLEFGFAGTDDYLAGMVDLLQITASSTGLAANTIDIAIPGGATVATATVTAASPIAIFSSTTFSGLPSTASRMQVQSTVAAGDTVTLSAVVWRRKR